MLPDIPRLRKAVEWAEAEAAKPFELREWHQARYVLPLNPHSHDIAAVTARQAKAPECGTCYCIAGKVVVDEYGPEPPATIMYNIDVRAAELLNLDYETDAAALFHEDNTIEDVRRIAEDIAGERL